MVIKTRFFGEVEINEDKVITFESGIPGFENLHRFLFMTSPKEGSPFCWLQSIEDTDTVFTIMDVFRILPNYNPVVDVDSMKDLGEFQELEDDIAIYNITCIPKDFKETTVNLKAPIVINLNTNKAKQIICNNDEYPIKFKVYDIVKKAGE